MIFYFTATGNSKFIADRIATATGDQTKNIAECVKAGQYLFELAEGERLGFVVPVYYYGTPTMVNEFMRKFEASPKTGVHTFVVLNCGGSTGDATRYIRKYLEIDALFGIKTVDNYVPLYKIVSDNAICEQLDAAEHEIDKIANMVKAGKQGAYNPVAGFLPQLVTPLIYPIYKNGRKTKKFKVNEKCTGCGQCKDICPCKAIGFSQDGKPVWSKPQCEICLACLHRCPAAAIEYGKSAGRGQYVNKRVT